MVKHQNESKIALHILSSYRRGLTTKQCLEEGELSSVLPDRNGGTFSRPRNMQLRQRLREVIETNKRSSLKIASTAECHRTTAKKILTKELGFAGGGVKKIPHTLLHKTKSTESICAKSLLKS
ncbi:hypothetical protein BLNAU_24010 [Blattamonas nauphoetae]|uniref:Transposase n=1 Tax=Blattamonas nauphoetae TaxID=2049346 RepID=A0ABQ9WNL0_9EUKA|nr:hypothetical protein BLNAU_24010 [Blattamonas nauphoetae]